MKLQTPVTDETCKTTISYGNKILLLGSCFSDNIGSRLRNYGFDVCINPFGPLYNPLSIGKAVERLKTAKPFSEQECVMMGSGAGLICSFSHHTSFARKLQEEFLENANSALERAAGFYANCDRVIITLGTSWYFRHIHSDTVVSNCLKRDASEFDRKMLSMVETTAALKKIIEDDKKYIFTISPIRHLSDGAHGNQVSKASLMIAADNIVSDSPAADYFPAYEIMMDELRDYRFYDEDMLHPSSQAADYIFERFCNYALPDEEHPRLQEAIKAYKRSRHIEGRERQPVPSNACETI